MPLLYGHDADVARWVGMKMEGEFFTPSAALGMLDKDGTLRGGFVLTPQNTCTAELTLYSEDVISNGMVRGFFHWCFITLGVHRLQLRTTRKNKQAKRAAPKMGFKFEGIAREFFGPGEDALLFYMTPDQCRWIKPHGTVQKAESAGTPQRQADGQRHHRAKSQNGADLHSL